ncbi:MAG: redoxin domain-containing protein [Deltaproteobacteria bacterium]|nr:redoxin domain-containing protein [Deltaproteobacteria bacterium]
MMTRHLTGWLGVWSSVLFGVLFVWCPPAIGSTETSKEPVAELSATLRLDPAEVSTGGTGKAIVEVVIPEGFHLWAMDPGPGPEPLTLSLEGPIRPDGPWYGPRPTRVHDVGFGRVLAQYQGRVAFERLFRPAPAALAAQAEGRAPPDLRVRLRGQICTHSVCVAQTLELAAPWTLAQMDAADPVVPTGIPLGSGHPQGRAMETPNGVPSMVGGLDAGPQADPGPSPGATLAPASVEASFVGAKRDGVLAFMRLAFLFGLLALATPCVFPAIPLTVSFFSKYAEERPARSAALAGVYAATMVASFTLTGVLVSLVFGVTRIQSFAAHPVFNLMLGVVLVFFSLNLLGLFEIETPRFLITFANRLETRFGRARNLANNVSGGEKRAGGWHDYLVVAVAAMTATTVFFTCTVAFVGLMLVEAAQGAWFWPTIGMLAFATAFALPFFVLALFPRAASRLRGRGGHWMSATRVTMGFLELAASFKFFSNADLVWALGILSREVVLSVWIAVFVVAALYLLGKVQLASEGGAPVSREAASTTPAPVSVLGVLGGVAAFGTAFYLGLGLYGGRAFGNWIDGWLPPMSASAPIPVPSARDGVAVSPGGGSSTLRWFTSLDEARAVAERDERALFVNYTGYTCTNCRYMESAVFPRPEIARLLERLTLVMLHTDDGSEDNERNRQDQIARFKTIALPLYVVEAPDGRVVDTFPGSTNEPEVFRAFLERALARLGREDHPGTAGADEARLRLPARPLSQQAGGVQAEAVPAGRWALVNFWATYCPPCLTELRSFMAEQGRRFERQGGAFVTVAVEDEEALSDARRFMAEVGVPESSTFWIPVDLDSQDLDPRLGFSGVLPHTVLVSPSGSVVWKHSGALTEAALQDILTAHAEFVAPR